MGKRDDTRYTFTQHDNFSQENNHHCEFVLLVSLNNLFSALYQTFEDYNRKISQFKM